MSRRRIAATDRWPLSPENLHACVSQLAVCLSGCFCRYLIIFKGSFYARFVVVLAFVCLCSLVAHVAVAQTKYAVSPSLDFWITNCEKELVGAAMPCRRDYSFRPTSAVNSPASELRRTIKHLAANNYRMAANIPGAKPLQIRKRRPGPTTSDQVPNHEYLRGRSERFIGLLLRSRSKTCSSPWRSHLPPRKTPIQFAVDAVAHPMTTTAMCEYFE